MKYEALLEGLEIKEIMLKTIYANKDYRIDSQFHTETVIKNLALSYKRIGDILLSSQYGISIEMNENRIGYPIYRMNEIHSMLCDLNVNKSANINLIELGTFKLNDKDVLFNRTNSYEWVGRTGVYYNNEDNRIFASYLVRFIPDPLVIKPEYLACFLSSKFGVKEIKRRARESINQTNVNPEEVKEIEIPILSEELQNCVEDNFVKANRMRIDAATLYNRAENFLLREISLYSIDNNATKNIKSLKDSFLFTGRLDAEYYQPKYDSYLDLIKNYHNGFEKLSDLCELKNDNYLPNDETQYKYIELSNIGNNGEVTGCTVNFGKELPSRARRIVKEGDVLISSIEGSLSSCALVTKEYDGAICSTGFYVMKSKKINSETLLILFKSELMQNLLKQRCSGTILTAINNDEFKNLLLPIIDDETQQKIASLLQQTSKLKKQSEQLLEIAKKAVEIAIEQNEATAIDYINSYSELMQEDGYWD